MQKIIISLLAAGSMVGAAQAQQFGATQYAQPQAAGNPLASIFQCQNPGNRQGSGAVLGGVLGGVIGNQVAGDDDRTLGTVLGAALGAAAGSYIGCRMGAADQQRAQTAVQTALAQGRSQAWTNPQNGSSGRVDIVQSYTQGGYAAPAPVAALNINTVRWTQGVEQPREFQPSDGLYQANGAVNIRSGPSARSTAMGQLRNGETIDGVVRVEGTDWVLLARNGVAVGYASETNLRFLGVQQAQQQQPVYDPRLAQTCRVFDQSYTPPGGRAETQRYTACQSPGGEWLVTA